MPEPINQNAKGRRGFIRIIFITGLIAGALDAIAAIINYMAWGGKNPVSIFRFIASGVFGKEAFSGGDIMAAWGLLFHFFIAFCFTLFFFLIYPRLKFLSASFVLTGILYGIFVWLVMNRVVLPLSNTPKLSPDLWQKTIAIFILIIAVGVPIAFMAGRYYRKAGLRTA